MSTPFTCSVSLSLAGWFVGAHAPRRSLAWYQVVLIKNYFQVLKVLFCVFRKFVPKQIPSFIDATLPLFVENVGIFCFFLLLSGFPLTLQKTITLFKWTLAESGSERKRGHFWNGGAAHKIKSMAIKKQLKWTKIILWWWNVN